ncbi:MAG: ABC-type transport auxiliary lipoprotein family protein [Desulfobacteraceae bacterium]
MTKLSLTERSNITPQLLRSAARLGAILILALLTYGCGKPPILVQRYLLDYPAPVFTNLPTLEAGIGVEQFSVAQAFNTNAMVYQPQPFKSDTYHYHRWRVNPGYMVTDYLVRDLRDSGLFQAVMGPNQTSDCRFRLEGGVEECQEIDDPAVWQAALTLHITLLDTNQKEITRHVVFQKKYQALEPLAEKTPGGLAQGMSQALQHLSTRIISDVYQAARSRLGDQKIQCTGIRTHQPIISQ